MPVYQIKLANGKVQSFEAPTEEAAIKGAQNYWRQLQENQVAPSVTDRQYSPLESVVGGIAAGASLNWADEMKASMGHSADQIFAQAQEAGLSPEQARYIAPWGAAFTAPLALLADTETSPEEEQLRQIYDAEYQSMQAQNPWAYLAGEAAGAIGTGLGAAKVAGGTIGAAGSPWLNRAMYPVIGGVEGMIYGSGGAQPGQREAGALVGGATGAVAGAAAPALLSGFKWSWNILKRATNLGDQRAQLGAADAIRHVAELEGVSVNDVSSWMQSNPDLTLGDFSPRFRNLMLESVASGTRGGRETAASYYNTRNAADAAALPGALDQAMGTQGRTYRGTLETLEKERGTIGDEYFAGIYEGLPKPRYKGGKLMNPDELGMDARRAAIFRNPDFKEAWNRAGDAMALRRGTDRPISFWDQLQAARRYLGSMGNKAKRAGDDAVSADLYRMKSDVTSWLDDMTEGGVSDASGRYATTFEIGEAAEAGRNLFRGNTPFEVLDDYADLTGDAKQAFVTGVKDAVKQQVLNGGGDEVTTNILNKRLRGRLKAVLGDDAQEIFDVVDNAIERAGPGVHAARIAALSQQSPPIVTGGVLAGMAIGNPLIVATNLLSRLKMRVEHLDPKMADYILGLTAKQVRDPKVAQEVIEMLTPVYRDHFGEASLAGLFTGGQMGGLNNRGALDADRRD